MIDQVDYVDYTIVYDSQIVVSCYEYLEEGWCNDPTLVEISYATGSKRLT